MTEESQRLLQLILDEYAETDREEDVPKGDNAPRKRNDV